MYKCIPLSFAVVFLFPNICIAQATVTVTGGELENTNSRPKDAEGSMVDANGDYYGPEQDGVYKTLHAAVEALMTFSNGGTILINSSQPVDGSVTIAKPLSVVGTPGANQIDGSFVVKNTKITIQDIDFIVFGDEYIGEAVTLESSDLEATNVRFLGRGISMWGKAESSVVIRDSLFDGTRPNAITGFGSTLKVDIADCEFRNIQDAFKGIVVIPGQGLAQTTVRDCTFTDCRLPIDDRHMDGESLYENLVFKRISWIGLNVQENSTLEPGPDLGTHVRNCLFEDVYYQGLHLHAASHVRIRNCVARGCGAGEAFGGDGAGIGGHDGSDDVLIEDCDSSDNIGCGFNFDTGEKNITLSNNKALRNKHGMRFRECVGITVDTGNWISENRENGILLAETADWKIHSNTIGLNQEMTAALPNGKNGIALQNAGEGEIGAPNEFFRGNVMSGNVEAGIFIESTITGDIHITRNFIGTAGDGVTSVPNGKGVLVQTGWSQQGNRLDIGGDNPSVAATATGDTGEGNLISGNTGYGIEFVHTGPYLDPTFYNVSGNYIGVDRTGMQPLPNQKGGIRVAGPGPGILEAGISGLFIGLDQYDTRGNVISGNTGDGVLIENGAMHVNAFKNLIGVGIDGSEKIPNRQNGMKLQTGASRVRLEKNVIWFNEEFGICADGDQTVQNRFVANSIHRNTKDGIRLLNNANGEVKAPRLDRLFVPGRSTTQLDGECSIPNGRIELFVDPVTTDSGYWGQGKKHIRNLTADDKGEFSIDLSTMTDNGIVTATVTDDDGNTSQFSPFLTGLVTQAAGHKGDMLVAGKPTAVRVFGDTGKGTRRMDTTGSLKVADGSDIASRNTFKISPFAFYDTQKTDRKRALNSLNFHIPGPTVGKHRFEMRLSAAGHERAHFELGTFHFQDTREFSVGVFPVWAPERGGGPAMAFPDLSVMNEIGMYMADLYPVNPTEFMKAYRLIHPVARGDLPHSAGRRHRLYSQVESLRHVSQPPLRYGVALISYDTFFEPPGSTSFLYGSTFSSIPQVVGMLDKVSSATPPVHNGETLAHEIGHTPPFNLGDTYIGGSTSTLNPRATDPTLRDASGNYILEKDYAYSPTGARVVPGYETPGPLFADLDPGTAKVYDFMGYGSPAWVDANTYRILFEALGGTVDPPTHKTVKPKAKEISPALIVSGTISQDGTAGLFPLKRPEEAVTRDETEVPDAQYQAVLLDKAGTVLDSQPVLTVFEEIVHGKPTSPDGVFNPVVPVESTPFSLVLKDNAGAVRIEIRKGDQVLAFLEKSPSVPVVTGVAADTDSDLPFEGFELRWTAMDNDPGQTQNLFFDVLYTPDEGETLIPVAANLTATNSTPVFTQFLPGSDNPVYIVRASDGWSQGESSSTAFAAIEDHKPSVQIVQPAMDSRHAQSLPLHLSGLAYDIEDGMLSAEQLTWSLAEDGSILGTGSRAIAGLPLGKYTVRLTAVDSFGHTVSKDVVVEIVENPNEGTRVRNWMLH